jgi:hypothetical protein
MILRLAAGPKPVPLTSTERALADATEADRIIAHRLGRDRK